MQIPSATRPQRPLRRSVLACEMRLMGNRCTLPARRVSADPRKAGINHITNARHGERSLGDIGCENNPAAIVRLKDFHLLVVAEPRTRAGFRWRPDDVHEAPRPSHESLARRQGKSAHRHFHPEIIHRPLEGCRRSGRCLPPRDHPISAGDSEPPPGRFAPRLR